MTIASFQHYGISHLLALAITVVAAVIMVRFMRSDVLEKVKTRVRYIFGSLLIIVVLMDPVRLFCVTV